MRAKHVLLSALALVAAGSLAACSTGNGDISSPNKETDKLLTSNELKGDSLITYKGGSITVKEFYENLKTNTTAQQLVVEQLLVSDLLEKEYGDKVTSKDVDEAYNQMKSQVGEETLKTQLTQNGFTEESYKATQLRTYKLLEYAIEQEVKKNLTDKDYEEAFKNYTPEIKGQIIVLSDQGKAKEVLDKAKAGEDFGKLAKENSLDAASKEKNGEVTFDSTSTTVPSEVQKAMAALNDGQIGESVVSVVDYTTYQAQYYVVKVNSKTAKPSSWKDIKDKLEKVIVTSKQNDTATQQKVVADLFKKYNVTVKDPVFQNLISQFANPTSASSTGASSSSAATDTTSSSSAAGASSTEASTTTESSSSEAAE